MNLFTILLLLYYNIYNQDYLKVEAEVFFYEQANQDIKLISFPIINETNIDTEEYIEMVVNQLFKNNENKISFIPEKVEIKKIEFNNGLLELTLSNDIMKYGGTMWEEHLVKQIITTLFSIKEVNQITIIVQDLERNFATVLNEGTEIKNLTREQWKEWNSIH